MWILCAGLPRKCNIYVSGKKFASYCKLGLRNPLLWQVASILFSTLWPKDGVQSNRFTLELGTSKKLTWIDIHSSGLVVYFKSSGCIKYRIILNSKVRALGINRATEELMDIWSKVNDNLKRIVNQGAISLIRTDSQRPEDYSFFTQTTRHPIDSYQQKRPFPHLLVLSPVCLVDQLSIAVIISTYPGYQQQSC